MFRQPRSMNLAYPGYLPAREIERFFHDMLGALPVLAPLPASMNQSRLGMPAVNMWEDDSAVSVEAEFPGLTMHDVEVTLDGSTLTIKGARREQPTDEKTKVIRRERATGEFGVSVSVPGEVDHERVSATLEHGVLLVTLPKAAASKARKIEIKTK